MSGLIYYIRGALNKPSEDLMLASGLIGETVADWVPCHRFIDGSSGTTFSLYGKFKGKFRVHFENSVQVWQDIPNTPLSIGYNIDQPPQADDFLKQEIISGRRLLMGNGQEFLIPIARRFTTGCLLPFDMGMLCEGKFIKTTMEKYLDLQKLAEKLAVWYGMIQGQEKDREFFNTDEKVFNVACKILSTNYHLSKAEITILKIVNSSNALSVLENVIDVPYLEELEKQQSLEDKKKS